MAKKPEDLGSRLADALVFLSEMGAEFAAAGPQAVERRAVSPEGLESERASIPAPGESPRDPSWLAPIVREILDCQKCPLAKRRRHAVPGEGGIDSGLMLVGEGPGQDEDIQGRPFVGRAGQMLTRIIQAMGYRREDVYITNVIKCQPPGNRTPLGEEVDACSPYLIRQIEVIQPRVIVALGAVSASFFIPGDMKISALRGTFFDFGRIKVMPTYHPSYLVRNEGNRSLKKLVWDDMQKVMALLGKR